MKKTKLKKVMIVGMLAGVIFASVFAYANLYKKKLIKVAQAEDDEGEDDEEDDGGGRTVTKTTYKTVYTKLPDTIVTTTKQVPRYDSDKDGKYDDEDPHPTINEFLIVKDDNRNGIDDRYEQ